MRTGWPNTNAEASSHFDPYANGTIFVDTLSDVCRRVRLH
jgi:hypothetical protein